jgi:hypothetical protein
MPRHRPLPTVLGAALAALAVLPAAAAAQFTPERIDSTAVGSEPAHVLIGDVNGDGRLDQIVTTEGTAIWHRLNSGDAGLGAPGQESVSSRLIRPLLVDANRDGILDLVAGLAVDEESTIGGTTAIYGAQTNPLLTGNYEGPTDTVPTSVSAPRIDNNIHRDRAYTTAGGMLVSTRTDDGTHFVGAGPVFVPVGDPVVSVSGDFDGDGRDDVAVAGAGAAVAYGNGTGFGSVESLSLGGIGLVGIADLVATDLDRDGRLDLVGSNPSSDHLLIWRGSGAGLGAPFLYAVPGGFEGGQLDAGRLDGDDRPDLALTDSESGWIVVLRTGSAGVPVGATTVGLDGATPNDVAIGDVDGDGVADISAVDTFGGNLLTIFSGPRIELPSPFELGQQAIATQSGTQTLVVRNRGWAPVVGGLTAGGLPEGSPFDIAWDDCDDLLLPGETCAVGLRFAPFETGLVSQSMTLSYQPLFAPQRQRSVTLQGTGIEPPQGPEGPAGPEGPEGPQGPGGSQGPTGPDGPQGPQGPGGSQGPDGLTGPQGPGGANGAQGPAGQNGAPGAQGAPGPQGPVGPRGPGARTGDILVRTTCARSGARRTCTVRVGNAKRAVLRRGGKAVRRGTTMRGLRPGVYRLAAVSTEGRRVVAKLRVGLPSRTNSRWLR